MILILLNANHCANVMFLRKCSVIINGSIQSRLVIGSVVLIKSRSREITGSKKMVIVCSLLVIVIAPPRSLPKFSKCRCPVIGGMSLNP